MEDEELLRYSRQIMLPDVDIAGQERLSAARVLIIGAGGLGSPAALYLAAAGVGHITLVDHDHVELTNLQRQIAHHTSDLGSAKVESAATTLSDINPHIEVSAVQAKADDGLLQSLVPESTVVLDCTDNFTIRYLINQVCWQHKVPLVSGAAIGWEGQVSVFDANQADSPCYQCLYGEGDDQALNCAENGVIAPLVGIIGTTQALEAMKVIMQVGEVLIGRVLYFDGKYMEWRSLVLKPNAQCPVCGG